MTNTDIPPERKNLAFHGIDLKSGRSIVMSGGHPTTVGAKFDTEMQEWVIYDYEEEFERICK